MPLYEYRCRDCGEKLTVRHGMDDPPPAACPLCGGDSPVRLVARVAVVKSTQDRVQDLSWVDRNLAQRIRKKVSGRVNPPLSDALDQMESH
jgi:putative FmdB family regulatory protein